MAAIPSDPAQLAALIKSQNLATLLATMTGNGGLAAGKTVEAKLVALDDDGNATALVNGVKVALVLAGPEARQAALQPGASLTLKLTAPAEPGAPLQATLVGIRPAQAGNPNAPAPAGQPTVGTMPAAPQPAQTATPASIAAATAQSSTAPAALQAGRTPTASATPVASQTVPASPRTIAGPLLGVALGRQDSLAPLFANLGSLAQGSVALTLPKPLMALVDQILAQCLPTAEAKPVTAEALKAAIARSGVFLEARQAAGEAPRPQTDLKAALQSLRDLLKPAVEGATAAKLPLPGEAANEAAPQPGRLATRNTPDQDAAASTQAKARPAPPRDWRLGSATTTRIGRTGSSATSHRSCCKIPAGHPARRRDQRPETPASDDPENGLGSISSPTSGASASSPSWTTAPANASLCWPTPRSPACGSRESRIASWLSGAGLR
ncbi:hypothetical protein BOS5A_110206 [Bosea sp. EC-HK365B]|nr:hypothetical protein BOS5A_110206 [Bosea sp. EC-HK365B]